MLETGLSMILGAFGDNIIKTYAHIVEIIVIGFYVDHIIVFIVYIQLVNFLRWNVVQFLEIVLVNVALNQTWTALLIWLIITFPQKAIRLSPVISAVAGFTSGFFIPIGSIPLWLVNSLIM